MRAILPMLASLLAACGSTEGTADLYGARFLGGPVSAAVATLGPPQIRAPEPPGERLLWEFTLSRDVRRPIYEQRAGLTVIAGYRTEAELESCVYEVRTDAAGTVAAQRMEGAPGPCLRALPR